MLSGSPPEELGCTRAIRQEGAANDSLFCSDDDQRDNHTTTSTSMIEKSGSRWQKKKEFIKKK